MAEIAESIRRSGAITAAKVRAQLRAWRVDRSARRHARTGRAGAIEPGPRRQLNGLARQLRSQPILLVVAVGVLGCAAIAFLIGRSLPSGTYEPAKSDVVSTRVDAGHLTMTDGIGWQQATAPAPVTQLLTSARVVAPAVADIFIVFGDLPADRVPSWFDTLGIEVSSARQFKAGPLVARAYEGVLPGSSRQPVSALLIPTSAGISTAICLAGAGRDTSAVAGDCQAVLSTVALSRAANPTAASPSSTDAVAVDALVDELNARRTRDAGILDRAATPGRQANAALALKSDYSAAADRASAIEFTDLAAASGVELVAQLKGMASALGAMARAADANSQAGYEAALTRALRGESQIAGTLNDLTALGYGETIR